VVSISLWLLKHTKIFSDRMLGGYQSQYERDIELKIFNAATELSVSAHSDYTDNTDYFRLTCSVLYILSYIGKCVICTILTYKFSYIFFAYSTLCLTGNILQHTYIAGESRLPKTERVEVKCKDSTQMCFERDCMEHNVILRRKICS